MTSAVPPLWPHCGRNADPATNPVGCRGILIPGHSACLAHLNAAHRAAYLGSLSAGSDVDHRGTPFSQDLLAELLSALRDPAAEQPVLGRARFGRAVFSDVADFADVTFTGRAEFDGVVFRDYARFKRAKFERQAQFLSAQFMGEAAFSSATFGASAVFLAARFNGITLFTKAEFSGDAVFRMAKFEQETDFRLARFARTEISGAQFVADVVFTEARFTSTPSVGPLVCAELVDLTGCVFESPITFEISAGEVRCVRTRWESTADLRLRYAAVDLSDAVLSAPTAVTAHAAPFLVSGVPLPENMLNTTAWARPSVQVTSIQGVDAAHLVLTDTDLTSCRFTGAFHLDQIHIEGRTTFAPVPEGLHLRAHIWPIRWSQRRTLAEEHHWRAQAASQPAPSLHHPPTSRSWRAGPHHGDPARTPDPEDISAAYRQLRKAFEDAKNEPGAADFYYGEMEMRRHSRDATSRGERGLLHGYWLLSGYGLRASRAFSWLAAAVLTTILLLMGFGLPNDSPKQEATGTVPAGGGRVTFTIDKDDPHNPTGHRFTGKRFDKALNVTLNSVVFRSSGTDLTTAGTYIEMASRFFEPALLALAVLAIRGRIKR
ncbi:pentapeptide repeat-containing protein [Streptomyces mirabilis]|uniref:pentapeptide repeat-containing protein n=1 Tax=Streptomyces mirabilis TaxID=68239 RepID=UPI0036CBA61B